MTDPIRSARALLYVHILACALACSVTNDGDPEKTMTPDEGWTLTETDFARPWVLLRVPHDSDESVQGLTYGPDGFLAVIYKKRNKEKLVMPGTYHLATSIDGVNWNSSILEEETMDLWYQVAQARGRIVIAGMRASQFGLLRSSTDGKNWDVEQTATNGLKEVAFVNGHFFALGILGGLLVSDDGVVWQDRSQKTAQNNAIAFGNGRWVVAGNTNFIVSTDSVHWEAVSIECSDEASCPGEMPAGWQPGQPVVISAFNIFFARNKFYAGKYVSSDGRKWETISDPTHVPSTFQGGVLLRFVPDNVVNGSKDTLTWTLKTDITDENPAGYTCDAHPCFIVNFGSFGLGNERAIVLLPRP